MVVRYEYNATLSTRQLSYCCLVSRLKELTSFDTCLRECLRRAGWWLHERTEDRRMASAEWVCRGDVLYLGLR